MNRCPFVHIITLFNNLETTGLIFDKNKHRNSQKKKKRSV